MVNPLLPLAAAICLSCLLHPHLVGADGKDGSAYEYLIGAGRYDITGPAAEVNMVKTRATSCLALQAACMPCCAVLCMRAVNLTSCITA